MHTTIVADCVHGLVELSRFEKEVLSAPVFNRLHNVLQNSTVYLTYPSCRTSRFSHSLGVMHLSGEFFYRGLLNATPEIRQRFLDELDAEISEISDSEDFKDRIAHEFPERYRRPTNTDDAFRAVDLEVLYHEYLPAFDLTPTQRRAFLIGFQAVRLAGLLHDVGHPPLSHVTESALDELRAEIDGKRESEVELTPREVEFVRILDTFTDNPLGGVDGSGARGNTAIHEAVGLHLSDLLLKGAWRRLRDRNRPPAELELFLLCSFMTVRIESDDTPFTRGLHSIIASSFDADRLDYIARDALASGLSAEPFRYERLRNGLQLVYSDIKHRSDLGEIPLIIPSVRSLSDVERFFKLYQDFYKYVVHHHRVVRTDGLVKMAIRQLAGDYLSANDEVPVENEMIIPKDISGLWVALDTGRHVTQQEYADHYLQWDDNWLFTILRDSYFDQVKKEPTSTRLKNHLEEVLANQRSYYSLFKGLETFMYLDEAFIQELPRDFDVLEYLSPDQLEWAWAVEQAGIVNTFSRERDNDLRSLRRQHGFFICILQSLWKGIGNAVGDSQDGFVMRAAKTLVDREAQIEDVIVMSKDLKRGVQRDFPLHSDGQIVELETISRLARDLRTNINLFPPFFVYVASNSYLTNQQRGDIRDSFGKCLADEFIEINKKRQVS